MQKVISIRKNPRGENLEKQIKNAGYGPLIKEVHMFTKTEIYEQRKFEIYEKDYVNNVDILIAVVYCERRNNDIWQLGQVQKMREDLYEANRAYYEDAIEAFRNDCVGRVNDSSIVNENIEMLNSNVDVILMAIAELDEKISSMLPEEPEIPVEPTE